MPIKKKKRTLKMEICLCTSGRCNKEIKRITILPLMLQENGKQLHHSIQQNEHTGPLASQSYSHKPVGWLENERTNFSSAPKPGDTPIVLISL